MAIANRCVQPDWRPNADTYSKCLPNSHRDANSYSDGNTYGNTYGNAYGDSNGHTDSYTKWWNANSDTYRYAKSNAEAPAHAAPAPNAPVRKPASEELVIRSQLQS